MSDQISLKNKKKVKVGKVIRISSDKTAILSVSRTIIHPLYKKNIKRHKNFMFHDELNKVQIGDVVRIMETKPISKRKNWILLSFVRKISDS